MFGSSAITKSSNITGFFYPRDAILSYEIMQQFYFLPPINSSFIQHIFDIKNLNFWYFLYITQKYVYPYMYLKPPTVITLHKQSVPVDTYSLTWQQICMCLVAESKKWRRVIRTFTVTICLFKSRCQSKSSC